MNFTANFQLRLDTSVHELTGCILDDDAHDVDLGPGEHDRNDAAGAVTSQQRNRSVVEKAGNTGDLRHGCQQIAWWNAGSTMRTTGLNIWSYRRPLPPAIVPFNSSHSSRNPCSGDGLSSSS
jgi:hypothetical protein